MKNIAMPLRLTKNLTPEERREARTLYQREWRRRNIEQQRKYSREYYMRNRERIRASQHEYAAEHREEYRMRSRAYYWRAVWHKLGKTDAEIEQWLSSNYGMKQE